MELENDSSMPQLLPQVQQGHRHLRQGLQISPRIVETSNTLYLGMLLPNTIQHRRGYRGRLTRVVVHQPLHIAHKPSSSKQIQWRGRPYRPLCCSEISNELARLKNSETPQAANRTACPTAITTTNTPFRLADATTRESAIWQFTIMRPVACSMRPLNGPLIRPTNDPTGGLLGAPVDLRDDHPH